MYKVDGESIDHLFIHCPMAKELWDIILSLFGVFWVMSRQVWELIEDWRVGMPRQGHYGIWNAISHCLMSCLWWQPNLKTFEDSKTSIANLKLLFFRTLFEWLQASKSVLHCFFLGFYRFLWWLLFYPPSIRPVYMMASSLIKFIIYSII